MPPGAARQRSRSARRPAAPPQAAGEDAAMAAKACVEALARRLGVDAHLVSSKIDAGMAAAWQQNQAQGQLGVVDCGRIRRAVSDPRRPGFLPVGVSKQRGRLGQSLSPFHLEVPEALTGFATATGSEGGARLPGRPLELVWQAAKVKKSEIGPDGLVTDAYLKRRTAIYNAGLVKRRYIKREEIGGTLLSWRSRAPVSYVASRKFYCIAYSWAVAQTPSFQLLMGLRESGFNVLLLGPDGHPFFESSKVEDLQVLPPEALQRTFGNAYKDETHQFGHERVLAAMLLGQKPWEQYADPTGGLLPDEACFPTCAAPGDSGK